MLPVQQTELTSLHRLFTYNTTRETSLSFCMPVNYKLHKTHLATFEGHKNHLATFEGHKNHLATFEGHVEAVTLASLIHSVFTLHAM